jgi:hypothetical protein
MHDLCPNIVFLLETKQQRNIVCNLSSTLGLNKCFTFDGHGKGGGLTLYWHDSIKIEILSYGMHHIDTLIWLGDHHAAWRCTFVYGEPQAQDIHNMWELLKRIITRSFAPWLMIGDFNESMW